MHPIDRMHPILFVGVGLFVGVRLANGSGIARHVQGRDAPGRVDRLRPSALAFACHSRAAGARRASSIRGEHVTVRSHE